MLELYTDGSAGPTNPGPGGWAVISTDRGPVQLGHSDSTTNIRMEGLALLAAVDWLAGRPAIIHTDSLLWVNTVHAWAPVWFSLGWVKKDGGEPKNLDIVVPLFERTRSGTAQIRWVRGHNGDEGNHTADKWANKARLQKLGRLC
jgi:ribonuclease HI